MRKMKTVEQIAQSINIPEKRIKALVFKLFGDISEIDDDQFNALMDELNNASKLTDIKPTERRQLANYRESKPVLDAIGIGNLKANKELIQKVFISTFIDMKNSIDANAEVAVASMSNYAYEKISQSHLEIARNIKAVNQEFSNESFKSAFEDMLFKNHQPLSDNDISLLEIDLASM